MRRMIFTCRFHILYERSIQKVNRNCAGVYMGSYIHIFVFKDIYIKKK